MKIIYIVYIWFAKLLAFFLKLLNKGSGTALPGLIAEKYLPSILPYFARQVPTKILITGTNGKTTTQTILKSILQKANKQVIANVSGSNLKRGLISTFLKNTSVWGKVTTDVAIFETEEATMPKIVIDLKPNIIIVTNLFRDQLDAYGEVDRTQKFIRQSIETSPKAILILNADDPRVGSLADGLNNPVIYYGLDKEYQEYFAYEGAKTMKNAKLKIKNVDDIKVLDDLSTNFTFAGQEYHANTPGIFHVYNALAAIVCSQTLNISSDLIKTGVAEADAAFGRGEIIEKDGSQYKLLLVKNPAGMTLTLNLLKHIKHPNLVFILNDKIADGRDVSWIWDAQMEILNEIKPANIIVSGQRAEDMLLRIKYALGGLEQFKEPEEESKNIIPQYYTESTNTHVYFTKSMSEIDSITRKLGNTSTYEPANSITYVLPTYTAMLAFRKYLLGSALNE